MFTSDRLQRRHSPSAPQQETTTVSDTVKSGTQSSGRALDRPIASTMGSTFGFDFSNVRIFDDAAASNAAKEIQANAFTVGDRIVFGSSRYQPSSPEGSRLLTHELTHVVQNARSGASREKALSHPSDVAEREAIAASGAMAAGAPVHVSAQPSAAISREGEGEGNGSEDDDSPVGTGLWQGATALPYGFGAAAEGVHAGEEAGEAKNPLAEAARVGQVSWAPMQMLSEALKFKSIAPDAATFIKGLGGFFGGVAGGISAYEDVKDGNNAKGAVDAGTGLMSAGSMFTESSILGENGLVSLATGAGVGENALAMTRLSAIPELGAGAVTMSAGALLASGGVGALAGHELYKNTEVGEDSVDALGSVDRFVGNLAGEDKDVSVLGAMDEYRQEQWDKGGLGYVKGAGAALGEGTLAAVGAIGGLGTGAVHGAEYLGSGIASGASAVGDGVSDAGSWLWDKATSGGSMMDLVKAKMQSQGD